MNEKIKADRIHENTTKEDRAFDAKIKLKSNTLSPQEKKVLDFVCNFGYTLSATARRMGITQQMVSKYWKRIQEKMR